MTTFARFIVLSAFLLLTGCGTVMHGTTQNFGIESNPVGAVVTVDGKEMGQTPLSMKLSRKKSHMISISLAGYENFQIVVDKKLSKWAFGDLLLGGPIGLIVDHSTGGIYRLTPAQLNAQLGGTQMATNKQDGVIYMQVAMEADPNWEQVGTLSTMRRKPSTEH